MSGRDAARSGYQGERLHLRVNRLAAGELGDLLESAATDPTLSPMLRRMSLVLPDGRRLEVSVQVTDDGVVYDEHGEYVDEDGRPHADIAGDFAVHVAASRFMAAATNGYRQSWTPDAAAAVDLNRIRQAVDTHLSGDVHQAVRDRIIDRAMAAADATRTQRLADTERRTRGRDLADRGERARGRSL